MGKTGGFKEYERQDENNIAAKDRIINYKEFFFPFFELKINIK